MFHNMKNIAFNQTMTIFLTSGQPLGKNRFYYLPRGTEIYIKDQTNKFKLC